MQDNIYILPSREPVEIEQALKSNLPTQLTSFIGREQEMAQACTLLRRPDLRLLTLTGPGGVGKTRLALQVASDVLDDFADGVYFISLAPISDPALVIPTIAHTFALRETRDHPPLDSLKTYLGEKHLLLLLDNFEQVLAAASLLLELLQACFHLKLLVTSRAVLRVSGEQEFAVPPLALPDLKQLPEREALLQYLAVALFLQRVQASRPDFQLKQTNAHAIAEICTRLDGLPLAIELAAARIKLLPPETLLKRLQHRLQVLTSGARDAPARQQTLRSTFQWSYDLLSAQEQRLFRRLSVFTSGCTLEAATAVVETIDNVSNAGRHQAMEVLEGVASLIDKHLLQQTAREGEEPRLLMLETIREYGIEHLHNDGELEATRQAHAAYYTQLVEEAFRYLFSSAAAEWFEQLEQEYGNLRAAFEWALERENDEGRNRIEVAVRLGSVLWRFWTMRGYLSEGRSMLERLLVASARSGAALRAKVLYALGALAWFQEAYARLEALCEEQLALCQQIGDQRGIALAFCGMTIAAYRQHDIARAQALSGQWVVVAKAAGDTYLSAAALLFQGRLASAQDNYPRAQLLFEEALALFRGLGYQGDIAWPLIYMARNLIRQGELARARVLLEEALMLCRTVNYKWALAHTLGFLGQVTLAQGDVVSTHEYLTESLRLNQEVGNQRSIAWSFFLLASVVFVEGKAAEARALYEQSLSIATVLEHRGLIASCLQGLAAVVAVQGQPGFAVRLWGAAEATQQDCLTSLPHVLRTHVEQAQATARIHLGDKSFASAVAEGRVMTLEQIFAALKTIMAQSSSHTAWTQARSGEHPFPHQAGLTTREVEVLRLVAQGLTDAQVAEHLVISRRTVNWYLTSIYSKIGVSTRSAATRYSIEQKLV